MASTSEQQSDWQPSTPSRRWHRPPVSGSPASSANSKTPLRLNEWELDNIIGRAQSMLDTRLELQQLQRANWSSDA
eukprot:SAG31_NODE_26882_length_435_cov_0.482143_1_plen_75_part_01